MNKYLAFPRKTIISSCLWPCSICFKETIAISQMFNHSAVWRESVLLVTMIKWAHYCIIPLSSDSMPWILFSFNAGYNTQPISIFYHLLNLYMSAEFVQIVFPYHQIFGCCLLSVSRGRLECKKCLTRICRSITNAPIIPANGPIHITLCFWTLALATRMVLLANSIIETLAVHAQL